MIESPAIEAVFDPKVKLYLFLQGVVVLTATFVGLLALPLWVIAGPWWANRYFPTIRATLTDRSLVYAHGVWFRKEMNIPLDKIQDLSLLHGPVLDAFGLSTLRIETAGGSETGHATLSGVVDAAAFRAEVIRRRDALREAPAPAPTGSDALLREIRDSLLRIEARLGATRD